MTTPPHAWKLPVPGLALIVDHLRVSLRCYLLHSDQNQSLRKEESKFINWLICEINAVGLFHFSFLCYAMRMLTAHLIKVAT